MRTGPFDPYNRKPVLPPGSNWDLLFILLMVVLFILAIAYLGTSRFPH